MVVGVHQAGQDDVVAQVKDGIGRRRKLVRAADLFNYVVANKEATTGYFATFFIHRDQDGRVFNQ
jgi:hypothetical protein